MTPRAEDPLAPPARTLHPRWRQFALAFLLTAVVVRFFARRYGAEGVTWMAGTAGALVLTWPLVFPFLAMIGLVFGGVSLGDDPLGVHFCLERGAAYYVSLVRFDHGAPAGILLALAIGIGSVRAGWVV